MKTTCRAYVDIVRSLEKIAMSQRVGYMKRGRTQFSGKVFSDPAFVVININAWHRINVAFETVLDQRMRPTVWTRRLSGHLPELRALSRSSS